MTTISNSTGKHTSFHAVATGLFIVALSSASAVHGQDSQAASTAELVLPLSVNEVMVALTDRSAEPFWSAAQKEPADEQQWDELEYNAMQIALSGVVISIPGTGKVDPLWAKQAEWQAFAKQLTDVGMRGFNAARQKDTAAISQVGDDLVEVCENCHRMFKPEIPTQGILMHSEYYRPK